MNKFEIVDKFKTENKDQRILKIKEIIKKSIEKTVS